MRSRTCWNLVAPLLTAGALLAASSATAADWNRFRGPNGSGVAEGTPAPLEFGPEKAVVWRTPLPPGKSSPVLAGGRVFLTAHEGGKLLTIALDRRNGKTLWTRALLRSRVDGRHELNDAAVPTPVTDGESLYVFFADFGLVAYSVDGQELWRLPLGPFSSPRGMASSPMLSGGVLVLPLEQRDDGAILGIDASSGTIKWKVPRPPSSGGSYSTAVAYRTAAGETQAVVSSPFEVAAYDPQTGQKLWWVGGIPHQPKSSPFVAGDLIVLGVQGDTRRNRFPSWEKMLGDYDKDASGFLMPGEVSKGMRANFDGTDYDRDGVFRRDDYDKLVAEITPDSQLMALRPEGRGDLTRQAVLWSVTRGVPRVTTPIVYNGVIYLVRNGGIFAAFDLATGTMAKQGRLREAIDEYFASPVAANGRILAASRGGKLTWVKAGADWEVLQVNDLGEECFATPALAADGVFVRTAAALYLFATGAPSPSPERQ
jgi:outer membrane protein assembly factor BamB